MPLFELGMIFIFIFWLHDWKIENAPNRRNEGARTELQQREIPLKNRFTHRVDGEIGSTFTALCCQKSVTRAIHRQQLPKKLKLKLKKKKRNAPLPSGSLFQRVECDDENDTLVNRTDGQCENSSGAIKKNISTVNE